MRIGGATQIAPSADHQRPTADWLERLAGCPHGGPLVYSRGDGLTCGATCTGDEDCFSSGYFCLPAYGECFERAKIVTVSSSPPSPSSGADVTVVGQATGSSVLFRFSVSSGGVPLFPCGDYGFAASCTWAPPSPGTYSWHVEARSVYSPANADDAQDLTVVVQP